MRKLTLLSILLLVVCSCNKEAVAPFPDVSEQMVDDAKKLFSACRPALTKSDCDDVVFLFTPGESEVEWTSFEYFENKANGFEGIESKLESTYEFRVIMPDGNIVWCDRELMYLKNDQTGAESIYMVYYLPALDYLNSCDGDLASMFDNSGDMGDFTGFKFYNTLDGATVRINEYCDGQCLGCLYLHDQKTDDEVAAAYAKLISMLGGVTLQKVIVQEKTKAFQMAVDEVQSLYFGETLNPDGTYHFPLGDESVVSAERDYGGGGAGVDESLWWLLYCLRKNNENCNDADPSDSDNHFGGASIYDSSDDGKEEETVEELANRFSSYVQLGANAFQASVDRLKCTIDSLLLKKPENKMITDVFRRASKLKTITVIGSGNPVSTSTEIKIPHDKVLDYKYLMEEMFHSMQRAEDPGWPLVNYEFEAKINDILLLEGMNSEQPFDSDIVDALIAFYKDQNETTFNAAVAAVKKLDKNNSTLYHGMTYKYDASFDPLKHLKGFTTANNEID